MSNHYFNTPKLSHLANSTGIEGERNSQCSNGSVMVDLKGKVLHHTISLDTDIPAHGLAGTNYKAFSNKLKIFPSIEHARRAGQTDSKESLHNF
jgi:hypothetical protein